MGRIVTSVNIHNPFDKSKSLRCDALVDTGASHLVLPAAWKERLSDMPLADTVEVETATQASARAEVRGTGDYSDRRLPGHRQRGFVHRYATGRWTL